MTIGIESLARKFVTLEVCDHTLTLSSNPGKALYSKFENLGGALKYAFPNVSWDFSKFSLKGKKSGQRWLKSMIEDLLPRTEILEEYQHPDLIWGKCILIFSFLVALSAFYFFFLSSISLLTMLADSGRFIELDLWIPQYQIGIEYQGVS